MAPPPREKVTVKRPKPSSIRADSVRNIVARYGRPAVGPAHVYTWHLERDGSTPQRRIVSLAMLLVLGSASSAFAGKQKIAVLGLEVKHTGSIDQQSTVVAHDLTEGLRTQAKAGTGPFVEAANSEQELIDQKVMH